MVESFQSAWRKVEETIWLGASFMNGAPGLSATVRVDQAGANCS